MCQRSCRLDVCLFISQCLGMRGETEPGPGRCARRRPGAAAARPSAWMSGAGPFVQQCPALEYSRITAEVPVLRGDVAQTAVQVLAVVPVDEAGDPGPGGRGGGEVFARVVGTALEGPEEGFHEGVVI